MDPVSITKHQTVCFHCMKHWAECECKCPTCLDAPMHACHIMCAVPLTNHLASTKILQYMHKAPHMSMALESAQDNVTNYNDGPLTTPLMASVEPLESVPVMAAIVARKSVEAEDLVPHAVRKKSVFSRLRSDRQAASLCAAAALCVRAVIAVCTRVLRAFVALKYMARSLFSLSGMVLALLSTKCFVCVRVCVCVCASKCLKRVAHTRINHVSCDCTFCRMPGTYQTAAVCILILP